MIGFLVGKDNFENNKKLTQDSFDKLIEYDEVGFVYKDVRIFFKCVLTLDKKEIQICTQVGGGSATKKFFCTYCSCTNHMRGLPSLYKCEDCLSDEIDEDCYHRDFLTSVKIKEIEDAVKAADESAVLATGEEHDQASSYNILARCVLRTMKSGASAEEYKDWCVKHLRKSREEVRTKQVAKQMHDEFILTYGVPAASVMAADVRKIKRQLWVRGVLVDTTTWQPHPMFRNLVEEAKSRDCLFEEQGLLEFSDRWWRLLMRFVLYMAEIVEYVEDSAAKEDKIVSKVELAMICGLHFELRVGQKLIQSLMNECRDHLTAAEYKERVISYTVHEAKKGRTPNPDIMCNR
jgi:hypothetical protein